MDGPNREELEQFSKDCVELLEEAWEHWCYGGILKNDRLIKLLRRARQNGMSDRELRPVLPKEKQK